MNYALVGAFVLVLGGALIAVALWLASGGAFHKKYDLYLAVMDESVAGLNLNAPVKFNGVDIGKVHSIALDKADPNKVRLLFSIEHDTVIKDDTVAVLKTQGLTGIAYVELSGGTFSLPQLAAVPPETYPRIRTKASLSARLENVLTTAMTKLDSMSTSIDSLLSPENREAVRSTLADLAITMHTIAARKNSIDSAIGGAERTFNNGAKVTAQMGPIIDKIGRAADSVEKMGNDTSAASKSAGRTIDSVGADLQRFTAETLPELERLMAELKALSLSLRRLSDQTERNPSSLIFGRTPVPNGPGETTVKAP